MALIGHNPAMVDVGLSLGAAAVKIACKIWLRDRAVAADASVAVADILEMKIADTRARRKVQRQFDQLEETVADRIVAVLGHEFRSLDEGERSAAVLAAKETLDRASLTETDLFDADLDPLYLERHVRTCSPNATRDLGEAGTALYDRLLLECCTDIVELTTALPEFGPAAFTEILRRETKLIEMFREILDRVPAREVGGRSSADAEFAAAYRAQVVNRLDRLRLFGVTQVSQRYPLTVAYVSLNVISDDQQPNEVSVTASALYGSGHLNGQPEAERIVRIEGALNRSSRLLIRGEAGSGKTTLLQWLAVRSARYDFGERLTQWNALVPFFVQLRQYVGRELPEPREFVRQIGRHLADRVPHGWVTELMASGLALVLVDGVDELPGKQRLAARRWLRELIEEFPQARYIVTSRPAAVGKDWLHAEGFLSATIEPMSPTDVAGFISKWHEAVGTNTVDAATHADLALCAQKLQDVLARRRHLRQLATNPLMCALLCALHYDRKTQLPQDRLEIYDAALEMLLERRDYERGVAIEIPELSRRRKMIILQSLAYWLVRNGWSDAAKERAIEQVRICLNTMLDIKPDPSAVLQTLMERSGVLREPDPDRINFVHRTFQEYLAARAIVDTGDLGVLLERAHDDAWHEVVVLAVGYAGAATREELLRGLLTLAANAPASKRNHLHLVALACLETAPQVSAQPRSEIEHEAARLLPPTTMTQADAIARSGEFGLELLMEQPIQTTKQAAAAIRAASLIGGTQALHLIQECAQHNAAAVAVELLRAWDRFDPEEYSREVLAHAHLADLPAITDPARLHALRYIQPQSLTLSFDAGHGDISAIKELKGLRYLSIKDRSLTKLSPLQACPNLASLELWKTGRIHLEELVDCRALKKLDFHHQSAINPGALRSFSQLDNIQISGVGRFDTVQGILPQQVSLQRFGMWNARAVGNLLNISADARLDKLHFLLLGQCDKLKSIAGVEAWASTMTGIFLHAPNLHDHQLLGALSKLEFANLTTIPIRDLSFTSGLDKLELLHVGGSAPLPDLGPLMELPKLRNLFLYGADNVDLRPLAGRRDLRIVVDNAHHREIIGKSSLGPGSTVRGRIRR